MHEARTNASREKEKGKEKVTTWKWVKTVTFSLAQFTLGLALLPSPKHLGIISNKSKHQSGRWLFVCSQQSSEKTRPLLASLCFHLSITDLSKCSSYCSGMTIGGAPYRVSLGSCYSIGAHISNNTCKAMNGNPQAHNAGITKWANAHTRFINNTLLVLLPLREDMTHILHAIWQHWGLGCGSSWHTTNLSVAPPSHIKHSTYCTATEFTCINAAQRMLLLWYSCTFFISRFCPVFIYVVLCI